jgi:serine/threonine protein kinase
VPCAYILQQYCNSGDLLHYVIGKGAVDMNTKERLKEQMRRRSKGQASAERPDLNQRKLAFEEIYSFFKDITSGLAHLHTSNYIHRDLKPSNCLLHRGEGNTLRCLISDFGEVQAESSVRASTGATGTISYCAPEVLKIDATGRYGNFTAKSDIFSLGMILYFMCFGRLPYVSAENIQEEFEDLDALRSEIAAWRGFQEERKERPDLPDQLYSFLRRLLAVNPSDRPSAVEILQGIGSGSGLDNAMPSMNPARKRSLGLGGRIQPVDSPAPPSPRGEDRSASGPFVEPGDERLGPLDAPLVPIAPGIMRARGSSAGTDMQRTLSHEGSPLTKITTPLLMAPPQTRREILTRRLSLAPHAAAHWVQLNQILLTYTAKLMLFLLKVYSIARPCLPWATSQLVAFPLLFVAALDIRAVRWQWRTTVALLLIHLLVLWWAAAYDVLCPKKGPWEWEAERGSNEL